MQDACGTRPLRPDCSISVESGPRCSIISLPVHKGSFILRIEDTDQSDTA